VLTYFAVEAAKRSRRGDDDADRADDRAARICPPGVETGRVLREEDAVKQALDLWIERERERRRSSRRSTKRRHQSAAAE